MAREHITRDALSKVNAASLSEVFKQQAENIEILRKELEVYVEDLKQGLAAEGIQGPLTERQRQDLRRAVFEKAFLDSVEIIQDKAINFLITEAVKATVVTQEFNYDLYVNHLLTAMEAHKEELIAIVPKDHAKEVEVKVNLNVLGKPEDWGKAIEAYRKAKGLGKSRGRTGEHGEMSSWFWKEKIYGAGREGAKITKGKPKQVLRTRKVKKERRRHTKDVTAKYRAQYQDTIAGRLASIPGGSSKAPFWHLIEHGNANVDLGLDAEGVPYPNFGPTHFARNTEIAIASAFKQIWGEYFRQAAEIVSKLILEIGGVSAPPKDKARKKRIEERKTELRKLKKLRGQVRGKRTRGELEPSGKLQAFVVTQRGRYEAYLQGNTVRVSLRDPRTGQFVKLPFSDWEKLADIYGI